MNDISGRCERNKRQRVVSLKRNDNWALTLHALQCVVPLDRSGRQPATAQFAKDQRNGKTSSSAIEQWPWARAEMCSTKQIHGCGEENTPLVRLFGRAKRRSSWTNEMYKREHAAIQLNRILSFLPYELLIELQSKQSEKSFDSRIIQTKRANTPSVFLLLSISIHIPHVFAHCVYTHTHTCTRAQTFDHSFYSFRFGRTYSQVVPRSLAIEFVKQNAKRWKRGNENEK